MGIERDFKEIIGALMHCIHGGEISEAEVLDLGFEADGALEAALSAAYLGLMDFALDHRNRAANPEHDRSMREELRARLTGIVAAAEAKP